MLKIKIEDGKCKELSQDGIDILPGCKGIEFSFPAGKIPVVTLSYWATDIEIEGAGLDVFKKHERYERG